ncbi:MAG: hypothetical protein ACKESB_01440 [Candidatus Hodgkinia cicadicola]
MLVKHTENDNGCSAVFGPLRPAEQRGGKGGGEAGKMKRGKVAWSKRAQLSCDALCCAHVVLRRNPH